MLYGLEAGAHAELLEQSLHVSDTSLPVRSEIGKTLMYQMWKVVCQLAAKKLMRSPSVESQIPKPSQRDSFFF